MDRVEDKRKRGWFWLHDELIDRYGARLKPPGIAVYAYLARRADVDGKCWPARSTIARAVGLSVRSVDAVLSLLADGDDGEHTGLGLISVEQRASARGRQISNVYTLLDLPVVSDDESAKTGTCPSPSVDRPSDVSSFIVCSPSCANPAPPPVQDLHPLGVQDLHPLGVQDLHPSAAAGNGLLAALQAAFPGGGKLTRLLAEDQQILLYTNDPGLMAQVKRSVGDQQAITRAVMAGLGERRPWRLLLDCDAH